MNVSFVDWVSNGWLVAHNSSKQEIGNLLGIVVRDLKDSQAKDVSDDRRFAIAYNATLQVATAALAAAGYRASRESHHYRVIQSGRSVGVSAVVNASVEACCSSLVFAPERVLHSG
jgi:hypothetical protein